MYPGIRKATKVSVINDLWGKLKKQKLKDKCSIRVFEGDLYSLMDDDRFYEENGVRKLLNIILYYWDNIRIYALKDEKEQGWESNIVKRTDEEQEKIDSYVEEMDKWMVELYERTMN